MNPTTTESIDPKRHARYAGIIIAAGFAVRLVISLQPVAWLTRHPLPDDAFYYFTIARNIVAGHGPTFDGIAHTNGFHPLWLALITPIFALFSGRDAAVHTVLLLCAVIDTATIALLGRYCRRLGVRSPGRLIVMAMYALSPALLNYGGPMNGMETALNVFLTLLFLYTAANAAINGIPNGGSALRFGLLASALLLARTDNVILLLVILPALYRQSRAHGAAIKAHPMLITAAVVLCITLPWLLWCQIEFGSPVQISGRSIAMVAHDYVHQLGWNLGDYFVQFLKNLVDLVRYVPVAFLFTSKDSIGFVASLALSALAATMLLIARRRRRAGAGITPPVEAAAVVFFAVQTARTVFMRSWYYYAFVPHLLARFAQAIDQAWFEQRAGVRIAAVRWGLPPLIAGLIIVGYMNVSVRNGPDGDKYRAVQELNRIAPEGSVVGAWNAGIMGYYFERGSVIDLDGVVNNAAFEPIRLHRLEQYARSAGITWLADEPRTMEVFTLYWNDGREAIIHQLDVRYTTPLANGADSIIIGRLRP